MVSLTFKVCGRLIIVRFKHLSQNSTQKEQKENIGEKLVEIQTRVRKAKNENTQQTRVHVKLVSKEPYIFFEIKVFRNYPRTNSAF